MSTAEKIKVLYVDDEAHNLISFKASFRVHYNVLIANNVEEGAQILAKHPDIHVILCDQRMPGVTGAEFLGQVRQQYPAPIRMLISGYADLHAITDAINRGNIFRFIQKPWQELDIHSAIEEGHRHYITSQALSLRNEELQKAYQELDKFAYSVTHDLRGPLHSALGAMELVKSIDDLEEVRYMLSLVERSLYKLDAFIENTHHYYTIRKGIPAITEIDFGKMVQDLMDVYAINGASRGIQFETSIQQSIPFFSDRMSLTIILGNLLTNAFKYQRGDEPNKFVRLEVEVDAERALVRVTDNGIGIAQEHTDQIFDMFYRATTESTGSGFGLYNVKDALRKLDGVIDVKSELGKGTEFTLAVPNAEAKVKELLALED